MMREQFAPLFCEVVNDAIKDGVPVEEVIGTLEIIKTELAIKQLQTLQKQASKPSSPQIILPPGLKG